MRKTTTRAAIWSETVYVHGAVKFNSCYIEAPVFPFFNQTSNISLKMPQNTSNIFVNAISKATSGRPTIYGRKVKIFLRPRCTETIELSHFVFARVSRDLFRKYILLSPAYEIGRGILKWRCPSVRPSVLPSVRPSVLPSVTCVFSVTSQ